MREQDCFTEIKRKAEQLPAFLVGLTGGSQPWQEHFGFKCIPVDDAWIYKETALRQINSYCPIKKLGLLRVEPNSMYDWHADSYRKSCVNMLVSQDHRSHTLFGVQLDNVNKKIVELKYEPSTYYLFNNQMQHCVINLDGPRYLLSLYFAMEQDYSVVRATLQNHDIC